VSSDSWRKRGMRPASWRGTIEAKPQSTTLCREEVSNLRFYPRDRDGMMILKEACLPGDIVVRVDQNIQRRQIAIIYGEGRIL
jgi:hypothetical protein